MGCISTFRAPRVPIAAALVLALPGCVLVNGCGGATRLIGGGASATRGATAMVRVSWPARPDSRLIPLASNSIRIAITGPDGFAVTQVIARPATQATFTNLPPGTLTVVASAHPDAAGVGLPAQAEGSQTVQAVADQQFQLVLTLASTIDRLEASASGTLVEIGATLAVGASARTAAGELVLTSPGKWNWTSENPAVATVVGTGTSAQVRGVSAGAASVVAVEEESGKSVRLALTVVDPFAGVKEYLDIDPANLPNYASPAYPVHYDANVRAGDNTPVGNPVTDKGASLGRVLFHDKRLSFNDTVACASCHAPGAGFVDTARFSRGYEGGLTGAHAMRLANIRFYAGRTMFWDKRAASVEAQSTQPIQNDIEMGFQAAHGGLAALFAKMAGLPYYPELFKWVYGDPRITEARVQDALAQFERSMVSVRSRFDTGFAQVFAPGQPGAGVGRAFPNFTAQEERGKALYLAPPNQGGAGCVTCHGIPTFSLDPNSRSNGLDAGETRIFKSPSLKNVGVTGPYMHDGRFATLLDVVRHYNAGIQDGPALDNRLRTPQGNPLRLNLSVADQNALVAFLKTLDDPELNADPKFGNPFRK
ncbi:MAG: cytochrome c peroxidase [Armatimonadota bacterium]